MQIPHLVCMLISKLYIQFFDQSEPALYLVKRDLGYAHGPIFKNAVEIVEVARSHFVQLGQESILDLIAHDTHPPMS